MEESACPDCQAMRKRVGELEGQVTELARRLEDALRAGERKESLQFLMENLRPRERKVLDLRFGLTGHGTHSLRQIGHLLRISKERVRQIQNRALEKLRASAERVGWEPSLLLG